MAVLIEQAIQFIQQNASPVEGLRLRWLLQEAPPEAGALADFRSAQREDGGWAPFWALAYSSLDATCFRLAQATQMGLSPVSQLFLSHALAFLARRQRPGGEWEEDISVTSMAPSWARPGDPAARLYLTANCAFWVGQDPHLAPAAQKAAVYLTDSLQPGGRLPSYPQAHWLAAGAFAAVGRMDLAQAILDYLATQVGEFSGSELAWMLSTFSVAPFSRPATLVGPALARLASLQAPDGRWASADGPFFDVHVTLEALFVLSQYGMIQLPGNPG